ncbi:MAG: sulfatase-like hydrolase/transferase [Pirellulaceae bacterium]|nr:sulfatase-like hydrolase/transferase [Pirellulaceae bacterium]
MCRMLAVGLVVWFLWFGVVGHGSEGPKPARPNLVVIMADDIGLECLGCYGSDAYKTPHLDALAASGMRFDQAHSQPICTPSRVQIMTGIYNNRNYIRFGLLDPQATTFGNLLRDAGYRTCIAGKWQLEGGFEAPGRFGFDRHCLWQLTRRPSRYPNPGLEIDGQEQDFKNGQFGPDLVTDYLCRFLEENREGPFLVYYPMILPHWPFVPTPDHPDWDPTMWRDAKSEPGGYRSQQYWDAMVRYTDKMTGKIVDKIDSLGLRENTLVIWTADNGTFDGISSPFRGRPYRGGKGSTKDNGTRVGFLASWPGKIPAGAASDSLVDFTDVLPTLADAAGVAPPADLRIDGTSLMPLFSGQPRKKDYVYCWYERNGVREAASQHVRTAHHKLYADGRFFDTQTDPGENVDLAAAGIPAELEPVHTQLSAALAHHMQITRQADPVQQAKRTRSAQAAKDPGPPSGK